MKDGHICVHIWSDSPVCNTNKLIAQIIIPKKEKALHLEKSQLQVVNGN